MNRTGSDSREHRLLHTLQRLLQIHGVELEPALTDAADLLVQALDTEKTDVFLYDPASSTLVAVGTSRTELSAIQRSVGMDRLAVANGGRVVEVFQTGRPYLTGHADRDPQVLRGFREGMGVRSMMAVALDVEGERRGVLAMLSREPDAFSREDQDYLATVAHWLGMIIARAELVERMTRQTVEQTRRLTAEELVRVLAHDLKNQMTPIAMRIHLIRRRAERDGRSRDYNDAHVSLKALEYLRAMIDNLLNDARLAQGLLVLDREMVEINALAHQVVEIMEPPGALPAIELETSAPLHALVDPARIQQVLENLLSNALKHSPAGNPVVVTVRHDGNDGHEQVIITVRDDGPGIAPDFLPHIFDRFSTSNAGDGLGLGLYLARAIAEAHGGALTVFSTPGQGALFELSLPVLAPGP